MSIKQKLLVLVAGAVVALLVVLGIQTYAVFDTLMKDRRTLIRSQVESAYAIVEGLSKEAEAGKLTVDEAKERARLTLRSIRFNETDYVFAHDYDADNYATTIVHPNAKVEGHNSYKKDPVKNAYIKTFLDNAIKGGGFTDYNYPRLGETDPSPKIGYSKAFAPWKWSITSALYVDDIYASFQSMAIRSVLWTMPLILLIAGASLYLSNSITRPIAAITEAMRRLSGGDLTVQIPGVGGKDEIGHMADATEVFRESMISSRTLSAEQAKEQQVREERAKRIEDLTRRFDESAANLLQAVTTSATEMEQSARGMAGIADDTNSRSATVASAAQQAAANVQTVASATEELSSSISEIGSQVSKSSHIASQAVTEAKRTDSQIQGLANAAEKIGQVVSMIAAIAEQTNLLALNATIEAARAGEAGRGFAVVAAEVKELASQTSKATEEITTQISAIQSETQVAVGAVQSIGKTVEEMNAIAAAIAAAVEQQGAATGEIARNVEEASRGTQDVTDNILGVSHAAGETKEAAGHVTGAASAVSRDASALKSEVETFLQSVRAA